jgi:hypothetical protein
MLAVNAEWGVAAAEYSRLITDETTDVRLLANRAVCYTASKQWRPARADWLRAVKQQPESAQVALQLFASLERWGEAAEFGLILVEQNTQDSLWWTRVAPVVVLSGDEAAYEKFCQRIAELAGDLPTREAADRATKACLLRPGAIDLTKLPGDALGRMLDGQATPDWFSPWGWSTRALLAWRGGDADAALKHVAKSEECKPPESAHAINLAVLALAHHQLQHPAEAAAALAEASRFITAFKKDSGKYAEPDLLTAEILLREADEEVNGEHGREGAGKERP